MEDKKSKESSFDYDGPFRFNETTDYNNAGEDVKQSRKMSSKEMEEYFAMMDAMEQDLENEYGKIDFER